MIIFEVWITLYFMSVLDNLCKEDKKWRAIALKICGDRQLADDLTQEMYLAVAEKKEVKTSYVYKTIFNKFLNHIKKNKETSIEEFNYLECQNRRFEPSDEEIEILDAFYSLPWRQQELIAESYTKSLRQINDFFPMIDYGYAFRQIKQGTEIVLGDRIKEYENSRYKHRKAQ